MRDGTMEVISRLGSVRSCRCIHGGRRGACPGNPPIAFARIYYRRSANAREVDTRYQRHWPRRSAPMEALQTPTNARYVPAAEGQVQWRIAIGYLNTQRSMRTAQPSATLAARMTHIPPRASFSAGTSAGPVPNRACTTPPSYRLSSTGMSTFRRRCAAHVL